MEHQDTTFLQKIKMLYRQYRQRTLVYQLAGAGIVVIASIILISVAAFFMPRTMTLSYEQETCESQWLWLPNAHAATSSDVEVRADRFVTAFGYPLASRNLCVEPEVAPVPGQEMHASVSLTRLSFISKSINIIIPLYPEPWLASEKSILEVSPKDEIRLAFSQSDILFQYAIEGNSRRQSCEKNSILLSCGLSGLELEQSEEYEVTITRMFHGQEIEEIDRKRIKTIDPLEVTESSITDGTVVYQKPTSLWVEFNKPLQQDGADIILLDEDENNIEFDLEFQENRVAILLRGDLERSKAFTLRVNELYADDRAMLRAPWQLEFETSGGPIRTGSNIESSGLDTRHTFRLTFDQAIAESQDDIEQISIRVGGSAAAHSVRVEGDQLIISPVQDLPLCEVVNFQITGKIVSKYNVSADIDWSTQSRTTCKRTSIIGHSVEGRPIYAYSFGNGARKVLYVGGMHGNEYSSVILMHSWIEELDARPDRIPNGKTIIVIPESSPDSVVARSRLNARGVDLNRNFPTNDWQSEVYVPGPTYLELGGGATALSEPESMALATFVRQQRPELVLTYHAVASVVISNDAGNSIALGKDYASKAGYAFSTTNDIEKVFDYQATGAFEDWIHDELGTAALLVELATMNSDEIGRNRDALWHTALLP